MKKTFCLLVIVFMMVMISGCKDKTSATSKKSPAPAMMSPEQGVNLQKMSIERRGTVVETMDASRYIFSLLDDGKDKVWVAGPQVKVKVGEQVMVPKGAPMRNYHSTTLNRDFELVYFVPKIVTVDTSDASASEEVPAKMDKSEYVPAGMMSAKTTDVKIDFSELKKAVGGKTVVELYTEKDKLVGKEIKVRGKVVKFSPQIMGKNWIHLKDGTGAEGTDDLTITTDKQVKLGDTILVSGVLVKDKDFGYGYKYNIIVEDATITVE